MVLKLNHIMKGCPKKYGGEELLDDLFILHIYPNFPIECIKNRGRYTLGMLTTYFFCLFPNFR